MESTNIESNTEYFAKKYSINAAIEYFKGNPSKYFFIVRLSWDDGNLSGSETVIVRREVISQFYGVDFVKSKRRNLGSLAPCNKEEFMELFDAIKFHQPKGKDFDKSLKINDKIFAIQNNIRKFVKQ